MHAARNGSGQVVESPCQLHRNQGTYLLRTVLKEIVVTKQGSTIRALLHWQGGDHTELEFESNRTRQHRWTTDAETVAIGSTRGILQREDVMVRPDRGRYRRAHGYLQRPTSRPALPGVWRRCAAWDGYRLHRAVDV